MRKGRVSEPAPREMICFRLFGHESKNRLTRASIVDDRTYVPMEKVSFQVNVYREQHWKVPLFMIGCRLTPTALGHRALEKGSSKYPSSTALSLDTLASVSVR